MLNTGILFGAWASLLQLGSAAAQATASELLPIQQAALMGQWIWNQVAYRSSRFIAL